MQSSVYISVSQYGPSGTVGLIIFEMGLKFYWAYIMSQEKCMAEIYSLSANVNL